MSEKNQNKLEPYLSTTGAWALSIGTAIGWGSLVVTCTTYLAKAGPVGVIIGLILGALAMLIIARCFYSMMVKFPSSGGIYSYAKRLYDYDRAFLAAWFLLLTYLAILWANATSLPLFMRMFVGDIFRFGYLYTLFGYDVYIGEVLLTIAAVVITAVFCANFKKAISTVMIILAAVFCIGIIVVFVAMIFGEPQIYTSKMDPYFLSDTPAIRQILNITCISSWAFIGFETISFSSLEFKFEKKNIRRILITSIAVTTFLYCALTILSVSAYPSSYSSWTEYIGDLGNLSGIEAIPAFYAAQTYMGAAGVGILIAVLLALVISSLIANTIALSRLIYTLGTDGILPSAFGRLNRKSIPSNAIRLVAAVSCLVPFVGRTAIGWIVDVTNFCAVIIYIFAASLAFSAAKVDHNRTDRIFGILGLIFMFIIGLLLLLPNLFFGSNMENASYLLFILWSVAGCVYFRRIIINDKTGRFGSNIAVWLVFLSIIAFMAIVWMNQVNVENTNKSIASIQEYYAHTAPGIAQRAQGYVTGIADSLHRENFITGVVVFSLFVASLGIMLWNFYYLKKRNEETSRELARVRNTANSDPLTGVKSKHAYAQKEDELDVRISGGLDKLGVVVGDVNGLKAINDSQGHKAGDEYLRAACMMICRFFKHSPVYRVGGDEFVVILEGADFEDRDVLLSDINDLIVANISAGSVSVEHPVVSLGMSVLKPGEDTCYKEIFSRADELMYARKKELKTMGAAVRD